MLAVDILLEIGNKVFDRIFPDPEKKDAAKLELLKMQQTGELAQLAADTELAKEQIIVNQEEAKSNNIFIAGWRPFIGWVCGAAFAYHFIMQPLMVFLFTAAGRPVMDLPIFDMDTLFTVLWGILGLGGMRSYEKIKGVAR